jgi:hypothetical protein
LVARLPHPLASGALTPAHAPVGSVWHHIFLDRFPDPLGFGFAASRFFDPRRKRANRFGVYYCLPSLILSWVSDSLAPLSMVSGIGTCRKSQSKSTLFV